jgi:hypothetical protein
VKWHPTFDSLPALISLSGDLGNNVKEIQSFYDKREAERSERGGSGMLYQLFRPEHYQAWSDEIPDLWSYEDLDLYCPVTWDKTIPETIGSRNTRVSDNVKRAVDSVIILELRQLFSVVLSVGGLMKNWKSGIALCNQQASGEEYSFIVPLHWYQEAYDAIKNYCRLLKTGPLNYNILRGSAGIGKSTFLTYLICRWLSDSEWKSSDDGEIDTIVIRFSASENDGEEKWGGFRKLKDGPLCFFELKAGHNLLYHRDVPVNVSFSISFNDEGEPGLQQISGVEAFDEKRALWIFDAMTVDIRSSGRVSFALGYLQKILKVNFGHLSERTKDDGFFWPL